MKISSKKLSNCSGLRHLPVYVKYVRSVWYIYTYGNITANCIQAGDLCVILGIQYSCSKIYSKACPLLQLSSWVMEHRFCAPTRTTMTCWEPTWTGAVRGSSSASPSRWNLAASWETRSPTQSSGNQKEEVLGTVSYIWLACMLTYNFKPLANCLM